MWLSDSIEPGSVLIRPDVTGRDDLFRLFARTFVEMGAVAAGDDLVDRLLARESTISTGIGSGVAVPHAQIPGLGRLVMGSSTHPKGIEYPSIDGRPVQLVFCVLGDVTTAADHLAGLARLARLARQEGALEPLVSAADGDEFINILRGIEGR